MKILYITSSMLKEFSISTLLAKEVLVHLQQKNSQVTVIERDLGIHPPAHLTLEVATAIRTGDTKSLTDAQKNEYTEILQSINELKEADIIIIGSPMYNLSISSGLKTWIDQICQAGLTFSYTEQGPKGLVNNKPVIIVSARGGIYSVEPYSSLDHQEPYLTSVLNLIGITDINIVRAEGININIEMKEQAIIAAKSAIEKL